MCCFVFPVLTFMNSQAPCARALDFASKKPLPRCPNASKEDLARGHDTTWSLQRTTTKKGPRVRLIRAFPWPNEQAGFNAFVKMPEPEPADERNPAPR